MKFRTALFLLSLTVPAYAAKTDVAAPPTIPFTKYRLDNGLEVILAPDKRLPIVAVNIWYHVGVADEALFHLLFPEGHPYRPAIMGSHADIQSARLADVRDFFKRYYRPNNATLVIAGDFDPANARRLVQKYFGPFTRGPDVAKPAIVTPPITAERRVTITDQIELPRI